MDRRREEERAVVAEGGVNTVSFGEQLPESPKTNVRGSIEDADLALELAHLLAPREELRGEEVEDVQETRR